VDRLQSCDPGRRAVATKTFPRSDLLFMDHFPGLPTVPGVLQIEMMAQTGGVCIRQARAGVRTLLGAVRSARFIRRVEPGDQCRITVEIERLRDDYALASGRIEVDGQKVSEAEILFALVEDATTAAPTPAAVPTLERA
jgi:3-hydroxyacyl-[acyl-carrier-protein] dehydratase